MKKYLLTVDSGNEKAWESFKKKYKSKGLGKNLDEAILSLIKKNNGGLS